MKKIIIAFAAFAAAFSLVSCNKEQIETASTGLKLNITVAEMGGGAATKAVKTNWADGENYAATPYNYESDTLTATLAAWTFRPNNTQVVISSLPAGTWALSCNLLFANFGFSLMDGRITTGNRNPGNYALPVDNANGKAYYMETYTVSNKKLKDDTSVLNAIKIDFSKFTAM